VYWSIFSADLIQWIQAAQEDAAAVDDMVEGEDDVVGIEAVAVVELDALAPA